MKVDPRGMANDGVPYVPVDDIPIEWRPAEASPRLKCWSAFPVDLLGTIGASLGPDHEPLTIAIYETQRRIALCSQRLKQAYLDWFQPSGPPGMHAHVHYQSPRDEPKRSNIESSMVVDYEAYLVFLDVALDLAAQAIGVVTDDPKMNWKKLLKLAERDPLPEWLSNDSAHAVRHLQRTALYARNNAVVHPKLLYSVVRTDNTGDVSYLRLPTVPPTEEMLTSLNNLVHRHFDLVKGARVGVNGFSPVIAMSLLDRASGKLSDEERKEVDGLRRTVGTTLPSVRDITEATETFLAGIVTFFGDRAQRWREVTETDEA